LSHLESVDSTEKLDSLNNKDNGDHGIQHPRVLCPPWSRHDLATVTTGSFTALTLAQQPSAGFGSQEIFAVFERLVQRPMAQKAQFSPDG
jgi:hypothetical protein